MNRRIGILLLTLILGITSCSSSFIARKKNTSINLKDIQRESTKVGVENEKVIILFDKKDLINLYEKDLKDYHYNKDLIDILDKLKPLKSDLIFSEKKSQSNLNYLFYQSKFHDLLKLGRAEIIKKESNNKIKKIKYTFIRDKLGGEEGFFSFKNGEEFYRVLLVLGE